ncbi:amino acid ABC transporter permease [Calorimonas adulescens]|uniref:Amino acid ABC transporter permease n=1 Tax=Calorimonas adulescens TaxID=2606906 RepID=A0A5D8QDI8_9THEO|nr:amino acid ABC transporter permease [Calorimonas adulescens]TZE82592.1 amino acid ABC transporter permease [Calorimonas adulescens]
MNLDFSRISSYSPLFVKGAVTTIELTLVSVIFGIILGLVVALLKMSSFKPLSFIGSAYVELIRGTPLLVQLYIVYYGLPQLIGQDIPSFPAAVAALSINSGAYVAEIIRAGIQAVDYGQMEAARSLGMSYGLAMRFVIIPQAIKNILPALGNEFVALLKESAAVSVISMSDLMRQADIIRAATYTAFEPLIVVALIYFVMTYIFSTFQRILERRLKASDSR